MKYLHDRSPWLALAALVCFVVLFKHSSGREQSPEPLLLNSVQSLGDLHTARFNYSRVFEHETSREPADWARPIPYMASLVHSATDNRALLSVSGSVEAGFDMSQSKVVRDGTTWVITLPEVALYQPHATARVFDEHSGMLWRDPNIGLDAEHLSASQFAEAALQGGIKDVARQEAVKRVTSLASLFTKDPIRVQFTS